jgi:hypothetical protein
MLFNKIRRTFYFICMHRQSVNFTIIYDKTRDWLMIQLLRYNGILMDYSFHPDLEHILCLEKDTVGFYFTTTKFLNLCKMNMILSSKWCKLRVKICIRNLVTCISSERKQRTKQPSLKRPVQYLDDIEGSCCRKKHGRIKSLFMTRRGLRLFCGKPFPANKTSLVHGIDYTVHEGYSEGRTTVYDLFYFFLFSYLLEVWL